MPQQYFVDDDAWLQFKFIVLLLLVNVSIVPGKIPIICERKIPKVNMLDAFFCQKKSFRRFRLAFGFGLQTFYLIDFS